MDPTDFVQQCHRSGCDLGPVKKGRNLQTGEWEMSPDTQVLLDSHKDSVARGEGEDHRLILADHLEEQGHPFAHLLRSPAQVQSHYGTYLTQVNATGPRGYGLQHRHESGNAGRDMEAMAKGTPAPEFESFLNHYVKYPALSEPAPSWSPQAKRGAGLVRKGRVGELIRKAAMVAISPSTETQDFPQAHSSLTSQNQQQLRGIAKQLFGQLGIKQGQLHDAIGDTSAWGAENSVAGWIDDDDIDDSRLKYLAAWLGNRYNQKNVLKFIGHSGGKDMLHDVTVGDANLEGLRDSMTKHGLEYRTIIPSKDGRTRLLFYDEAGKLGKNVQNFVETHRASLHTTPGTGEFIGDPAWASRPKAREQYRKTISEYESAQGGGNPAGPADRPAVNAPPGGTIVRGQNYSGGQRLPDPY